MTHRRHLIPSLKKEKKKKKISLICSYKMATNIHMYVTLIYQSCTMLIIKQQGKLSHSRHLGEA